MELYQLLDNIRYIKEFKELLMVYEQESVNDYESNHLCSDLRTEGFFDWSGDFNELVKNLLSQLHVEQSVKLLSDIKRLSPDFYLRFKQARSGYENQLFSDSVSESSCWC